MKPTVVILTYCEHPSLAYGTMMVFETLRVGFPTFNVVVIDNGSHPDVREQIEIMCQQVGAVFVPTARHDFIEHYQWMLCEQDQIDSFILLDPDVAFWKSVEDWTFDGVIAGRLIPDLTTGGITSLSRLHPSHVWVPDVQRLRALGITVELRQEGAQFWDTLATIYQDHPEACQVFTDDQLDCYDHLFYGSHFPAIEPRLQDDGLTYTTHRLAAAGNIQSLRGIWREQDRWFKSQTNVPFTMSPQDIESRMHSVCGELGAIQKVETEDTVRQLLANIQSQLPAATKDMLKMPQAHCPVVHHFGPGLCVREVFMPAGTLAIGHLQKFDHMNVLLKGSVMVVNDDGSTHVLKAPMMFIGKPGRKVGYVLEDMVWQNIYATELKNPDEVEAHFVEKNEDWQQDHATRLIVARAAHVQDQLDYEAVVAASGFTPKIIQQQVENPDDQIWVDNAITRVSDSPIHGKGLFVTHPVKQGEIICPARINGKRTQAGRYTNHAVHPNAKMVQKPNGDVDLVAICDIEGCRGGSIGTEVTIEYRQSLALSGVECEEQEKLTCLP